MDRSEERPILEVNDKLVGKGFGTKAQYPPTVFTILPAELRLNLSLSNIELNYNNKFLIKFVK